MGLQSKQHDDKLRHSMRGVLSEYNDPLRCLNKGAEQIGAPYDGSAAGIPHARVVGSHWASEVSQVITTCKPSKKHHRHRHRHRQGVRDRE